MTKIRYIIFILCVFGCSASNQIPTPTETKPLSESVNAINVAEKFLLDEYKVEWINNSDQYVIRKVHTTEANWQATYKDSIIYNKKGMTTMPSELVEVYFSKDFKKYYEDYHVLVDITKMEVVSVKKRKWDG